MEGVGARLGRTSTRYGPATVFAGPVRKWKKKWVHVSPSTKNDNISSSSNAAAASASVVNGGSNSDGSNGSHLLLYKWAPLSQGSNGNGNENGKSETNSPSDDLVATVAEDPPRRRFKYVPIAVLEEQKKEITEIEEDDKIEEDEKVDEDKSVAESSEKKTEVEEKPYINDVRIGDNQDEDKIVQDEEKLVRQDLNESTMDLGLNLNANNTDSANDPKEEE